MPCGRGMREHGRVLPRCQVLATTLLYIPRSVIATRLSESTYKQSVRRRAEPGSSLLSALELFLPGKPNNTVRRRMHDHG